MVAEAAALPRDHGVAKGGAAEENRRAMDSWSSPKPAATRFHWRLALIVAIVSACLSLALFAYPLAGKDAPAIVELSAAQFLPVDQALPPAAADPRWQPLVLPDLWSRRGYSAYGGWYRFSFTTEGQPAGLLGLYLMRVHQNVAVYLNGEFLGDGGRMEEPLARNWNTPLYFRVPASLLRPGPNELLIHLRTYPGFGMMAAPQLGPDALLKPRHEWRQWLQNELSAAITATMVVVGFYALALWWRRRQDSLYLWFGFSSFCWALFSTHLFVRYPPMPGPVFLWLTHTALDFWMVGLVGFLHRYMGLSQPRRERLLIAIQATNGLLFALLPIHAGYGFSTLGHTVSLLAAFYLAVLSWHHLSLDRRRQNLVLALGTSCLVLAGLHDWLMEGSVPGLFSWETLVAIWRSHFHLLFLAAPLFILFLAWYLTGRFVAALGEAERLNREMEERIEEAYQSLETSFAERRGLEIAKAAAEERERIHRDLHDDLGAKLLSLAIGARTPQHADLARTALQDLRDVVSRARHGAQPLSHLLADWRAEMERRLEDAGLQCHWQRPADLPDPHLPASAALDLGRILREAVTNVLRHAGASELRVRVAIQDQRLHLAVEDDGRGPPVAAGPGRGMRNMMARAANLGGEMSWRVGAGGGCCVELVAPLASLVRADQKAVVTVT